MNTEARLRREVGLLEPERDRERRRVAELEKAISILAAERGALQRSLRNSNERLDWLHQEIDRKRRERCEWVAHVPAGVKSSEAIVTMEPKR